MNYKTLLVSGCSFTASEDNWAQQLSSKYGLELINLAYPGAGNHHVVWSTISFLEKNNIDPETTLIGLMWSHPMRVDLLFERNPELENQTIYRYNYDDFNSLVLFKELLEFHKYSQQKSVQESYLQGNSNRAASAFKTWTLKTLMTSYLKSKKFTFFQSAFFNYLTQSSLIKPLPNFQLQLRFQYLKELEKIGLSHNLDQWINLKEEEYLGEFVFHQRKLSIDRFHPSGEGYKQWTEEILVPKLTQMGVL